MNEEIIEFNYRKPAYSLKVGDKVRHRLKYTGVVLSFDTKANLVRIEWDDDHQPTSEFAHNLERLI